MKVSAQYIQDHVDEFLSTVETGEAIEITRDGKEPLRLALVPRPAPEDANSETEWVPPQFGLARGLIQLSPDWDSAETNAEIADLFENSILFPPFPPLNER